MNKTERTVEILNQLSALSNEKYAKSELLSEMLTLQSQFTEVAFNGNNPEARIWNVYNRFEQMNIERGDIAHDELEKFNSDCRLFENRIRAIISGDKGENLTLKSLERLKSTRTILRNVEIESNGVKTELDFIVFTKKAIFIIEVKNTKKDIFIDENGQYFTNGRFMRLGCNIKEKMLLRERLLEEMLRNAGMFRANIVSLLVFTDNRIEVNNNCKELDVTFLSQLPYKIDRYNNWNMYSEDTICEMADIVNQNRIVGSYKFDMDVNEFKLDFANLISTLEATEDKKQNRFIEMIKFILKLKAPHKVAA